MIQRKKIPKYFTFKILLFPLLLYFLLVTPINGILFLKNAPGLLKKYNYDFKSDTLDTADNDSIADTLKVHKLHHSNKIADTLIDTVKIHKALHSKNSITVNESGTGVDFSFETQHDSKFEYDYRGLPKWIFLVGFIAGIVFNYPFKRYFRKKRKNKPISDKLYRYCKKYIQYTPLVNASLYAVGFSIIHVFSICLLSGHHYDDDLERSLFKHLFYISLISSVLTVLFVYLWQKYRMEFKYMEHIYTAGELQKNVYKTKRSHSIKSRLWLVTLMTTVLPLFIVIYYVVLSVSTVKELGLTTITKDQVHMLYGVYYSLVPASSTAPSLEAFLDFPFISTVDLILSFTGMMTSVIVAVVYIFFFVNWTNKSLNIPVKELLLNMKKTSDGELSCFSLVRTNDEMGKLTVGFNDMSQKIKDNIDEISAMNRDLEQKVIDRTAEVVLQKEEIETQRDLILEKNEELQQQKEEIITQKDEIEKQKKLVELKNKNITDSIRYALRIQKAILPSDSLIKELLPQSFIFFKPKDIVSGDFYWIKQIDNDNNLKLETRNQKLLIAAVDCTGHGVPGAFMSIVGNNLLNQAVKEKRLAKPAEILNFISSEISEILRRDDYRYSVKDGMDITLCLLDLKNMTLEYSGIHNPLYLIRNRKLFIYKSDYVPLGELPNDDFPGYTNNEIKLQKDDIFYLFSDGFIDQFGGTKRRKYLSKNFRETLLELHSLSMSEQKEMLSRIFEFWRGPFEQTDDILVVGIKI